ncbi:MAG: hexapeptide repeat-containing transferase [Sphingomonas bacterium]|uniref:gamma carbonic anhydrase family protein n=1 Tax=Sphingomonas bacterium TaxID=1895847 RepID=UPI002610EB0F|nr:gamma carbonic anhydrase family protein [Sphingomonas bacterium]MDB5696552.1 hexapeptide repeat-containing transferase [Sphingomonas bacterium]
MAVYALSGQSPVLAADCWIAPSSDVIGNVTIGDAASIWFGAVVRGDNAPIVIGPRSNVQDGAVLHSDPSIPLFIGADVTIGHMAMVHSCVIGDRSLVGIGAIVLAGARIGENCMIGAGALVTGRSVIPDGAMVVGQPGRVARMLSALEIDALQKSADSYVAKARLFAQGLSRFNPDRG